MKKQANKKDVLTFQQMIERLNKFWGDRGCVIAQPYGLEVGAGTANPMTFFRVLGPEPFNVAYVEPSRRPDDGRYGQNPNRLQHYYQYQIILKPAPLFNQELYIESLKVLGIDPEVHDIRFVEDNWESPAIGAWGLGWEVWLDGMEISQYTYFQQVAGIPLEVPALEITLGLERLAMYIQGVEDYRDIMWNEEIKYGDLFEKHEYWQSKHNYETANIEDVKKLYEINERQVKEQLEMNNYWSAYDYLLKISHLFNILDSRGVISVTDRVSKFGLMGKFSQQVGSMFLKERESLHYPILEKQKPVEYSVSSEKMEEHNSVTKSNMLVLELYFEELPVDFVINWKSNYYGSEDLASWLKSQGLFFKTVHQYWGPRRIVLQISELSEKVEIVKRISGPLKSMIYDEDGKLTEIGRGFLKKNQILESQLKTESRGQKEFICAGVVVEGTISSALEAYFKDLVSKAPQSKVMNWSGDKSSSFVRPLRNVVCIMNDELVPLALWGVKSVGYSYCPRGSSLDTIGFKSASDYIEVMKRIGVILDETYREGLITDAVYRDEDKYIYSENTKSLISINTYLTEFPSVHFAILDEKYTVLPIELIKKVLESNQKYIIRVLRSNLKHIEYGIVINKSVASRAIVEGNLKVVTSRLDDALFYWNLDINGEKFSELRKKLKNVIFHPKIGSYLEKVERIKTLVHKIKNNDSTLEIDENDLRDALSLIKNDRSTQMVNEFASLEGIIGSYYATKQGYSEKVSKIISEQYLPNSDNSPMPSTLEAEIISIADKLDNIVAFSSIGGLPKGSSDPYEIRKYVYALIRLFKEGSLNIDLMELLETVFSQLNIANPLLKEEIISFINQRLYQLFKQETKIDKLAAGVAFSNGNNIKKKFESFAMFKELMGTEEEVNKVFDTIKRIANILKDSAVDVHFDKSLIDNDSENKLYEFEKSRELFAPKDIVELSVILEEYFQNVRVNVEDKAVKENRLALLNSIDKKVRQLFAA